MCPTSAFGSELIYSQLVYEKAGTKLKILVYLFTITTGVCYGDYKTERGAQ
jgi:hypothetical protein